MTRGRRPSAPRRPGDATSRAPRPRIEPLRAALVTRIRREILEGRYDIASRMPLAIERLLADLASA